MDQPKRSNRSGQTAAEPTERRALSYALRLVKVRPRSSFEVMAKLRERGFDDHQTNSVVGTLLEARILDDERFVRDWLRFRDRLRPSGEWLLRHELESKGLDRRLIESGLEERQTPEWFEDIGLKWSGRPIEEVLAQQLAARHQKRLASLSPEKRQARLAGILERRGFRADIVWRLIGHPDI